MFTRTYFDIIERRFARLKPIENDRKMFSFEATIDGDEKVFHWIGKFPPKTDSNQIFNRAARVEETEISFYSGFVPALKEFVSGCFFGLKICSKLKIFLNRIFVRS